MADSDEEYDRRRRDKFRGERNDYDNRRPPKGYDRGRGRHEATWDRKRDHYASKDNGRDRKEFGGRNSSPPNKRSRRDWEGGDQNSWKNRMDYQDSMVTTADNSSSVPTLMSFKEFIIQQEDDIDEAEAVRRYQEYKVEFKRTQINDFFVMHKAEEWFKEKYHPTESVDRRQFIRSSLRKRLKVFLDLWEAGYMDNFSLTMTDSEAVLKLLDRVVVKLEGGSEEEVKAIDLPPPELNEKKESPKQESTDETQVKSEEDDANEPLPPGMEDEENLVPPGMEDEEEKPDVKEEDPENEAGDATKEEPKSTEENTIVKKYIYDGQYLKRPLSIFMRTLPAMVTKADLEGICKRYPGFLRVAMSEPSPERRYSRRCWATFEATTNIKDICWNLSNIRVKDADLTPIVNRDVINRVRPVNGVTNSPMCMQLDVSFALKLLKKLDEKHKLYEKEEIPEPVKKEEKEEPKDNENEIKESEEKSEETVEEKPKVEEEEPKVEEEPIILPESNPVLSKLPSDVEHMITGIEIEDEEDGQKEHDLVVNSNLAKALDLVLLYLRVVHCIDFYNGNEYVHEDEMPLRCGIMHVRAANPQEKHCKKDVYEWYAPNSQKLEHLLKDEESTTDEEAARLGKKKEEIEVENFIKANTKELAKDKWLCPLSGKKFRGPEFIRKHIMMKHTDSVDNVKMEVKFFNNYVYDPKRPCFPDPKRQGFPDAKPRMRVVSSGPLSGGTGRTWTSAQRSGGNIYMTPKGGYGSGGGYASVTPQIQSTIAADTYGRVNTFPPKARRGGYHDRRIIKYRDLDAPEESDFF